MLVDENGAIWAYAFKKGGAISKAGSRRTAEQAAVMVASGEGVWQSHYDWINSRATDKQVAFAMSLIDVCAVPVSELREWLNWASRTEVSEVINALKAGTL